MGLFNKIKNMFKSSEETTVVEEQGELEKSPEVVEKEKTNINEIEPIDRINVEEIDIKEPDLKEKTHEDKIIVDEEVI